MAATIALPCALGTNLRKLAAKPSSPHAMNCAHRRFASWRGSTLAAEAERLLGDASPLVRGAAVWALSQLVVRERFEALATKAMGSEVDESVRAEWRQASVVMPRESGASSTPRHLG